MAEADESMDPIDVLSDDERRPAAPNLTGGFFDDDSDLSDVGQDGHDDDRPDVRRVSAPTTAGSDKPYKTSADVVRERQQAGQASGPDPSMPGYAEMRRNGHLPDWKLSKATSSNASPSSTGRAPSRPKGTGVNLSAPTALLSRKLSNGQTPSSSLIVVDAPPPSPSPAPLPRIERKSTRSMDKKAAPPSSPVDVVEIKSSPPEKARKKVAPGKSRTKSKQKTTRMLSSGDEDERPPVKSKNQPAASSSLSKPPRPNRPVPSTAQLTARRVPGGGLRPIGDEWDSTLALSKKTRDGQILEQTLKDVKASKMATEKRVKGKGKGKHVLIPISADEDASDSSPIQSADEEKPKAPRPKPRARLEAKEQLPSPPGDKDKTAMAALLNNSRQRQQTVVDKQRLEDEKERERFLREGAAVLADGPMAQIRAAGGRGALRALGSTASFGNAVAGPSSQTRSRTGSNASSSSALTSLDSLSSDDELQLGAAPSKIKLCPYCSEPLPARQTKKLKKLLQRLEKKSVAMPTSANPDARSLAISKSSVVCALHRSESILIPEGVRKGYPLRIDWRLTIGRVREHEAAMLEVIRRKDSVFWEFAKERTGEVGKGVSRSARGQFDVFEKCQPGYFGEIGQILFHQTLVDMFARPPAPVLTSANCEPLTASDFIYWVLIPELAILLIQEDLDVSYREAFEAMKNSREFGLSVFGVEEGEQTGGALMEGWDADAEEVASGDERGITVLRRKLNKSVQHRKTKTSQRAAEGFPAYDPKAFDRPDGSSSGLASSQTARAGALRSRSPPLAFGSSRLSSSSSRAKRKEVDVDPEPEPVKKKPKPKPRLAPSGSMPDMLSSGSSAPFGLLSQDAVRHDVASLTLDSSPAEVPEIVMARPTPPPSPVPTLEADDPYDDLHDFDLGD